MRPAAGGLRARMREDVRAMLRRDPATRSEFDALCHSPGLHAVWLHGVAHRWWREGRWFAARQLSHLNRAVTGVEIHPAARIGRRCVIDHGMGVVIGETAELGDDVMLYQGVTLGGTTREPVKRHPTLESGVVVGAGATVLGAVTIGAGARIGAGAVVVRDVPTGATVVGVTGRVLDRDRRGARRPAAGDGDRDGRALEVLIERVEELEARLEDAELSLPSRWGSFSHGGGI